MTLLLAQKLNKVLGHFIHLDQVGFMEGRQSKDNTRWLINIINYIRNEKNLFNVIFLGCQEGVR